ncbi:hypothetical protein D6T65_13435 [Arthrobacter frigidicola]|nr:hypothetical protein D6T65_13435 [Arthrobacter frigidicola]
MSLEILLLPLGIAAVAAIKQARSTDLCEKCRTTRITDQGLLVAALRAMGATEIMETEGRLSARTAYGPVTFQRVGSVFLGRVDKAEAETPHMLAELDVKVGHITQIHTIENVRRQAAAMGMVLIEERSEDGTVQLVFEQGS